MKRETERGAPGSWSQLLHKTTRILVFGCGAVFGVVSDVVSGVVLYVLFLMLFLQVSFLMLFL